MQLNATEAFELRAEAFRIMTGHMAPGKSASHYSHPAPEGVRALAFNEWLNKYGTVVQAMTVAAGRILVKDEAESSTPTKQLETLKSALQLVMDCAGDIKSATDAELECALCCGDPNTESQANAWLVARAALR